jgi:hypothetical protein
MALERGGAMDKTEIYSPNQVFVGTFLGGPLASILMLKRNFVALGETVAAKKTIIWGIVLSVGPVGALYVIQKSLPQNATSAMPLVISFISQSIARHRQLTKDAIRNADRYSFRSNFHVVLVGIISLVVSLSAMFLIAFLLVIVGIIPKTA